MRGSALSTISRYCGTAKEPLYSTGSSQNRGQATVWFKIRQKTVAEDTTYLLSYFTSAGHLNI